jgi:hypothetical protein
MSTPITPIEFPFGHPPPDLHCPACGARILSAEGSEELEPCPHLSFFFVGEVHTFVFARPWVEAIETTWTEAVDRADEGEGEEPPDLMAYLAERTPSSSLLLLELSG